MALGAHGGDHIPQGTLQLLLNVLEFGSDPQEAVEEPRFYSYNFPSSNWASRYEPGMLRLEGRIADKVAETLSPNPPKGCSEAGLTRDERRGKGSVRL